MYIEKEGVDQLRISVFIGSCDFDSVTHERDQGGDIATKCFGDVN